MEDKIFNEQDYLDYWRDNSVETDENLKKRLASKYGPDHMLKWLALRLDQYDNPLNYADAKYDKKYSLSVPEKKGVINSAVSNVYNLFTNPRLGNGQANPFAGIGRVIVPSAAGAYAITNPGAVWNFAKPILKEAPAAILKGAGVDLGMEALTGKDWGHWVEDKTGIAASDAEWFNPGYWDKQIGKHIILPLTNNRVVNGVLSRIPGLLNTARARQIGAMMESATPRFGMGFSYNPGGRFKRWATVELETPEGIMLLNALHPPTTSRSRLSNLERLGLDKHTRLMLERLAHRENMSLYIKELTRVDPTPAAQDFMDRSEEYNINRYFKQLTEEDYKSIPLEFLLNLRLRNPRFNAMFTNLTGQSRPLHLLSIEDYANASRDAVLNAMWDNPSVESNLGRLLRARGVTFDDDPVIKKLMNNLTTEGGFYVSDLAERYAPLSASLRGVFEEIPNMSGSRFLKELAPYLDKLTGELADRYSRLSEFSSKYKVPDTVIDLLDKQAGGSGVRLFDFVMDRNINDIIHPGQITEPVENPEMAQKLIDKFGLKSLGDAGITFSGNTPYSPEFLKGINKETLSLFNRRSPGGDGSGASSYIGFNNHNTPMSFVEDMFNLEVTKTPLMARLMVLDMTERFRAKEGHGRVYTSHNGDLSHDSYWLAAKWLADAIQKGRARQLGVEEIEHLSGRGYGVPSGFQKANPYGVTNRVLVTYKDPSIDIHSLDIPDVNFVNKGNGLFDVIEKNSGKVVRTYRYLPDKELLDNFNKRLAKFRTMGLNLPDMTDLEYLPHLGGQFYKLGGRVKKRI